MSIVAGCIVSGGADAAPKTMALAAQQVDQSLENLERERGFAGAVIIESGNRTLLERGYGYADRENKVPFTVDTIAQIGSITKHFTAMTALVLADEGKLHLYRPIKTYLPDAPEPGASVTLDQLMTHTAGLAEYCGADDFTPLSKSDLIARCLSQPLLFEPGTKSEYSNAGFSIVGAVIEQVTGRRLEDVMTEKLFAPNGLNRTGYLFSDEKGRSFAYGYDGEERQEVISRRIAKIDDDWWALKGNGGIQASARDMARWRRVLLGQGKVKAQTVRAATTPRHPSDARTYEGYGLYVAFDNDGEVLQISHSGSDGVFFSYFWINPRDDTFFYLVGNSGEAVSKDAVREVRRRLYEAGGGGPSP